MQGKSRSLQSKSLKNVPGKNCILFMGGESRTAKGEQSRRMLGWQEGFGEGLAGGTGTAGTGGQHQQAGLDPDLETMRPFLVYRVFTYSPRVSQVIF